mmetsp:Transcript_101326/g.285760  ORF Transcript_101326/g.285760 Transcript_101326/m.285760 type:complete len:200 (+) Transcript_101326:2660-3259(+)
MPTSPSGGDEVRTGSWPSRSQALLWKNSSTGQSFVTRRPSLAHRPPAARRQRGDLRGVLRCHGSCRRAPSRQRSNSRGWNPLLKKQSTLIWPWPFTYLAAPSRQVGAPRGPCCRQSQSRGPCKPLEAVACIAAATSTSRLAWCGPRSSAAVRSSRTWRRRARCASNSWRVSGQRLGARLWRQSRRLPQMLGGYRRRKRA